MERFPLTKMCIIFCFLLAYTLTVDIGTLDGSSSSSGSVQGPMQC